MPSAIDPAEGTLTDARLGHTDGRAHEQHRNLLLQAELGAFLRNIRSQRGLTQQAVAEAIKWRQASYSELERGTRSTDHLGVWVAIAAVLQLRPEELLRKVWTTRGSLPLTLPPKEDPRQAVLLKLAIEQARVDDVLLALRADDDSPTDSG